jgi:hypothetical protein
VFSKYGGIKITSTKSETVREVFEDDNHDHEDDDDDDHPYLAEALRLRCLSIRSPWMLQCVLPEIQDNAQ